VSHDSYFQRLESRLLHAGVAPGHVRRAVTELREHLDDLVDAELATGCDVKNAQECALREMGSLESVVSAMRARPELLSWSHRYPRVAMMVYPLTCLALLPVAPVFAGVAHASQIARWGVCMMLGALVTGSMFLLLQLSILLS
jgi:hypothetical protein